jgi:hypothetical protein
MKELVVFQHVILKWNTGLFQGRPVIFLSIPDVSHLYYCSGSTIIVVVVVVVVVN